MVSGNEQQKKLTIEMTSRKVYENLVKSDKNKTWQKMFGLS